MAKFMYGDGIETKPVRLPLTIADQIVEAVRLAVLHEKGITKEVLKRVSQYL